jgi:hypothetical protein
MESGKHLSHHDRLGLVVIECAVGGHPLSYSLMRSRLVEIGHVLAGQNIEVPIIEQQDVIKHLASEAPYKSLGYSVHVGSSNRDLDNLCPDPFGNAIEDRSKFVIAVSQKHLRRFLHSSVPKLLGRPLLRRMLGDANMDDSSRMHVDNEKRIHLAEEDVIRLH